MTKMWLFTAGCLQRLEKAGCQWLLSKKLCLSVDLLNDYMRFFTGLYCESLIVVYTSESARLIMALKRNETKQVTYVEQEEAQAQNPVARLMSQGPLMTSPPPVPLPGFVPKGML